jgi:hypothetical protein
MSYGDVTIKTTVLPEISFTPGQPVTTGGFNLGEYLKPAIYVEGQNGVQSILYAPYGEPPDYKLWALAALGLLVILAIRGIR